MKKPTTRQTNFILGGIFGILLFFAIYGTAVLNLHNVEWLRHSNDLEGLWDLSQHYFGWVLYRNTPWSFPIGMLEGLSPEPFSIVYTDSIPLFAVIFKLLSPILPADFQYFGMFELLCYALMGGFGSLITARFTKNYFINGSAALFFAISPVLTKRVFYHSALSAHFLILIAICLWLYRVEIDSKKYAVYWVLLTLLATGINAYYVPMVLGILCISELERISSHWMRSLFLIASSAIASLLLGGCLGMFSGRVSSSAENIEDVSWNLLGFFNPKNETLTHIQEMPLFSFEGARSYSRFFGGWENYTPWQNEGFSYLGLGLIIGVVVMMASIIYERIAHQKKEARTSLFVALVIGILIFVLLALGPRATIGRHILYHIPWPESIYRLFSVFRTAGRLIWPVYYGVISMFLIWTARRYEDSKRKLWKAFLAFLLVVQILDVSPSLSYKHKIYANVDNRPYENELMEDEVFSYLGRNAEELLFVAPTQAISLRPYWSTLFEDYAIQNGITMNAAYCSRDTTQSADAYANDNLAKRKAGQTFPQIIYVFLTEDILKCTDTSGLSIYPYKDIYIGTEIGFNGR